MSEWRSQKIDLIRDLRFLRKDRGLTPDRMFVATTLEEVCGGNVQPVEVTRDRLISAIRSLPGQMSEALLAAYGLLPETEGLTTLNGRRRAYGVRVGRKSDTLADREDTAIEELALRLLNSYWAGAPLPPELPPLPHGGGS